MQSCKMNSKMESYGLFRTWIRTCSLLKYLSLLLFLFSFTQGQGPGGELTAARVADENVNMTISENRPPGTYVGTIPIKSGYTYKFNSQPSQFILNPNTGVVTTNQTIDREKLSKDIINLLVLGTGAGALYPIEVFIHISDENDNTPTFPTSNIAIKLSERSQPGTRIILDTATDPDVGLNGTVMDYVIVSGNEDGVFEVGLDTSLSEPFLYLSNKKKLDREVTDNFRLTVSVKDGGKPSKMGYLYINITILDFNDSPPIFDQSIYLASVNESAPVGTTVIQIRATDQDKGKNQDLVYSITGEPENTDQFEIDPGTGVITTKKKLVCQRSCDSLVSCNPNSCQFIVEAKDLGSTPLKGRAYVTVVINDENDHSPSIKFRYLPANSPRATVEEGAPVDQVVAVVSVTDADQGKNAETNVSIESGNSGNAFKLQTLSTSFSFVRVAGKVDREVTSVYNLTFKAQDHGSPPRTSYASMLVYVSDVNDHAPVFQKGSYAATLSELSPIGSYVAAITATDSDSGINAQIKYAIASGNKNGWFKIDSDTGLVTTAKLLDRETISRIVLNVSATDGGATPHVTYVSLTVNVFDENDEIPTFKPDVYEVKLSEAAPINTVIITVSANDGDSGSNGSVVYALDSDVSRNYPGVFQMDSSSGVIRLMKSIDREIVPFYQVKVIARDQGKIPLSSTATININVTDINDNSPIFYPSKYYAYVQETTLPDTSVLKVTATDKDFGNNALLSYSLQYGFDGKFLITQKTGVIKNLVKLKRTDKPVYTMSVTATDGGGRSSPNSAIVKVFVVTGSSIPITFTQPDGYTFPVSEDNSDNSAITGRTVGTVSARSSESGASITYSIVDGDPNSILTISNSGSITTAQALDREMHPIFHLTVVAETSNFFQTCKVTVNVNDVNDNIPRFAHASQEVIVKENWPVGHTILQVSATDPDSGANGQVVYTLTENPESTFGIDSSTGLIYIEKSQNLKAIKKYLLTVKATDSGTPQKSSTIQISVKVEDMNDHTPLFTKKMYEVPVSEALQVNTRFFTLTATDGDSGKNAKVTYAITNGNLLNKFGIFPTGALYIAHPLDRETASTYELKVTATDHATPPRSSTCTVNIYVTDANDNAPVFSNSTYKWTLRENSPVGTSIGRVSASDKDTGRNAEITYFIPGSQTKFGVHPHTGVVSNIVLFDREDIQKVTGLDYITFPITATDHGTNALTATASVQVMIEDVNDNPPVFGKNTYQARAFEADPLGTNVFKVTATDADDGDKNYVFYAITEGNTGNAFHIDAGTGQITVAGKLNRENQDHYTLLVKATDTDSKGILSATTIIHITILDNNDNTPVFVNPPSSVEIPETVRIGHMVAEFTATDKDLGNNALIAYAISVGNREGAFNIDSDTGKLYVAKQLDYERHKQYDMNITATDYGTPQRTASIGFKITVTDANDNAPQFPVDNIMRQISEGAPVGTSIVKITATDKDSGKNGEVVYSIRVQEPPGSNFKIDVTTGVITTSALLDREKTDKYIIHVVATDKAEPPSSRLSSEKMVSIIVTDLNDNAPRFVSMNAATVLNTAQAGAFITNIKAIDADAGENGRVIYEIVGSSRFSIDQNSGALRLMTSLAPSVLSYSVTVRAKDQGMKDIKGQQSSQMDLTVLVVAANDNGPQFTKTDYTGSISENQPISSSVITVTASYSNTNNARIQYYITSIKSNNQNVERLFQIGLTSGIISTTAILDRERGWSSFTFEVYAVDMGSGQVKTSKAQVVITLVDLNDSPPTFNPPTYSAEIPETAIAGRTVSIVSASDPDTIGSVQYSIISGADGKFQIDPTRGVITTLGGLDRETKSSYDLTIQAYDGVHKATAPVKITILDVNDNAPIFLKSVYSFDVPENTRVGTTIGLITAIDMDSQANSDIVYSLATKWGSDVFAIDQQKGILTVKGSLDYEQNHHYTLTVQATDKGTPSLSSSVTVYMNILDMNDNTPVFDPMTYNNEINENVPLDTSILTVTATDVDSGANGKIVYSIVSGDSKKQFAIGVNNGTIYTRKLLDREDITSYTLQVRATDQALPVGKRFSAEAQITITLKDINDNTPVFISPNVTWIPENTPANTAKYTAKAIDPDQGNNGYMEYSLVSAPDNLFRIGKSDGKLYVIGQLDREIQNQYTLVIKAADRGTPSLSATMTLTVNIQDANDNNPVFKDKDYSQSISEDTDVGKSLLTVKATDMDIGDNGDIRYYIVGGNVNDDFKIDSSSGVISVNKHLNYERLQTYSLIVQAEDRGQPPRSDTARVNINILDVNDNPPIFVHSPYYAFVRENAAKLPVHVTKVYARDEDSDANGRLTYSIKRGANSIFSIDPKTGEISANKVLDREKQDKYELVVAAEDSGNPTLTGTGLVYVLVEDVNDHTPVFEQSSYTGYVTENAVSNTLVTTVHATDADEGPNAAIRYHLKDSGNDKFTINPASGAVVTTAKLDRETQALYHLIVIAEDSGKIPKTATASITVHVEDDNDHAPKFEYTNYQAQITDPTDLGKFVIGVTALDSDVGPNGQVVYSLSGVDASKFSINTNSGVITAAQRLTASIGTLRISVTASDKASTPRSSTVSVTVTFVNIVPNPPIFNAGGRNFPLPENTPLNQIFTTLTAVSPLGIGISYSIVGGNVGGSFLINQNGAMSVRKALDYEITESYNLWIRAQDNRNPPGYALTSVIVTVSDVNDNPPKFDALFYNVSIMEEENPPQTVLTVSASDKDSGVNKQLIYSFDNPPLNNPFSIGTTNGEIKTIMKLDREKKGIYKLMVKAIDQGSPKLTATATVQINILDKNDNPPRFTRQFYVQVPENTPIGNFIIRITTSDPDIGTNAVPRYSFSSNPDQHFAIDSLSGNVTVAAPLDRETKNRYTLSVRAEDSAWSVETQLSIQITDINDNAPQFVKKSYDFTCAELQGKIAFVGQVSATDLDLEGKNSKVVYSLKADNPDFEIDTQTGDLLTKHAFTYLHTPSGPAPSNKHTFTVIAKDTGTPTLSSEVPVIVNIIDANNNYPVFEMENYFSAVPENAVVGKSIIQVIAKDTKDYGINAEIEYYKVGGNGSSLFNIEKATGWITVSASLTSSTNKEFHVIVKAQDKGSPPKSAQKTVRLYITGVNTFTPVFQAGSYQKTIPEDTAVGTLLATISANDQDSGLNGKITYSIETGNEKGLLSIGDSNGELRIAKPLDYDTDKFHALKIIAKDQGLYAKEASKVFTIYLTDVNDNSPKFNQSEYHVTVPESSKTGSSVFSAQAYDRDSGSNAVIEYAIVGDTEAKRMFSVDTQSGLITLVGSLNYESKKGYRITLIATNPGTSKEGTTVIFVAVGSVNEFKPVFEKTDYYLGVSESDPVGRSVGRVVATDSDEGIDGVVQYYLVGESNTKGFAVDRSSGVIKIAQKVDREKVSNIALEIMAKNPGPILGDDTAKCVVHISVSDANDPPKFSKSVYEARVGEDAKSDQSVITVSASDHDIKPSDRQFSYRILSGNVDDTFVIDSTSGLIKTQKALDRENIKLYKVIVGAVDKGTPAQTGSATVNINIDDINDNGPIFVPSVPTGSVAENTNAGATVLDLKPVTSDLDIPPNQGPYQYSMANGAYKLMFAVGQNTGLLTTRKVFNREEKADYKVAVLVSDAGSPKQTSTLTVNVVITDTNDTPSTPRSINLRVMTFKGTRPVGTIADVRPLDADTVGNYKCKILEATTDFKILQGCELSTPNIPAGNSYNIRVLGNDGVHSDVANTVTVTYRNMDNTTVSNSLILAVTGTTVDNFLKNNYIKFESAVRAVFSNPASVYVYGIVPFESKILVYVAVKENTNKYAAVKTIGSRIQNELNKVQQQSGVTISNVNFNPCSLTPCKNAGTCSLGIQMYDATKILSTPTFVLTSLATNAGFTCSCKLGFSGPYCNISQEFCNPSPCQNGGTCNSESRSCQCRNGWTGITCTSDVNECSTNPCQQGGTCTNTQGGYKCKCASGRHGPNCESSVDYCRSSPCQDGGTCINGASDFVCKCKFGFAGKKCEVKSYGFNPLSFMQFYTNLDANKNKIQMEFATVMKDALLFYYPGQNYGSNRNFMALEILNGRLRFSFALGESLISRIWLSNKVVNDGKWYSVTAQRDKTSSVKVTDCVDGSLTCTTCSGASGPCTNSTTASTSRPLDVITKNIYIGGVKNLDTILNRKGEVNSIDFVGCIRRILIDADGNDLLSQSPTAEAEVTPTCSRTTEGACKSDTCGSKGTCIDEWGKARCSCPAGYQPPDCKTVYVPFSFGSEARVEYVPKESYTRQQQFNQAQTSRRKRAVGSTPTKIAMKVQTTAENGIIFYSATAQEYTILMIQDGSVVYGSSSLSGTHSLTVPDVKVNDGKFHDVSLALTASNQIVVTASGKSISKTYGGVHDFMGLSLTTMSVGGTKQAISWNNNVVPTYDGCMEQFTIDDKVQPFSGSTDRFNIESVGGVDQSCPLANTRPIAKTPESISPGIIVVIIFFIVLVIGIIITVVVIHRRRKARQAARENHLVFQNKMMTEFGQSNGSYPHDSGFTENGEETTIVRNHIENEYNSKNFQEREVVEKRFKRPDIIDGEFSRIDLNHGRGDNGVIIENGDIPGLGYNETPERYDLDNASSIAPSDIDIVKHYRNLRKPKQRPTSANPSLHHTPQEYLTMNGLGRNYAHQNGYSNGAVRSNQSTPLNRASPLETIPSRHSPHSQVSRQSPHSQLSRHSPRTVGASPLSLPYNHGPSSVDSSVKSSRARTPNNRIPNGKVKTPIQGLTIEEVNRLNARSRVMSPVSTIDAGSTTDEGPPPKYFDLIEHNGAHPPDSSSDDASHDDSFTCSEFEAEPNERVRNDFNPGHFPKLQEVDESNYESNRSFSYDGGSVSTFLNSDDEFGRYPKPPSANLNWDYLLNWGPSFEKLVGVFQDIAALPDDNDEDAEEDSSSRNEQEGNEEYV